ncbi:hypothetical protein LPB140_05010 [Sphingorhabdus lutea]|uniref:Uncharacterized protein n=1 Tax=Sphingorhabdus lutea TaxID=1913578 RepID=A0A1L3JAW8_9SPHN|nr:hypothetical protein LPB140_05010 [Sphingorhabdus lutea]
MAILCIGIGAVGVNAMQNNDAGLVNFPYINVAKNDKFYQVRIEQRVIIRFPRPKVGPASTMVRTSGGAGDAVPTKFKEKKVGKCLWLDRLAGVVPGPNESLEIITKDNHRVKAYLADKCSARDFYAGAYVERSADGKLCVDRDEIHSRTGTLCKIDKLRLLVPEN